MPNIHNIIKSINKKTLDEDSPDRNARNMCNCRSKKDCPLKNQCLEKTLVYKALVKTEEKTFTYFGTAEGEFKTRYNNHVSSFQHEKNKNKTELSKKIWDLKRKEKNFEISWEIAKKTFPYDGGQSKCDLCLTEKLLIITKNDEFLLNKRNELISKCRHKNKFLLKTFL